jgi:RHS repeat-associated protein
MNLHFFRILIAGLILIIGTDSVFATSYTWTGTTSTTWATSTNWSPNGIPGSADIVTINSSGFAHQPSIAGNTTISQLTMTSGTLSLGGFTLTISTLSTFNGGTINTGTITSNGTSATYAGTTFGATVNATCGQVFFNGSVFNSPVTATMNGTSGSGSTGGNTFNSTLSVTNSSTSSATLASSSSDTYNGNVTFAGSTRINVSNFGDVHFKANITNNSSNILFGNGSGTMYLDGTGTQVLSGTNSFSIGKLTINKSSSDITANIAITVTSAFTFTSGNSCKINNGSNLFTFGNTVAATGASTTAYITGIVKKSGMDDQTFLFPVGTSTVYMPLTIKAAPGGKTTSSDAFQAQAFSTTPPNSTSFDNIVLYINPMYWTLSRTAGTNNINATLGWNSTTPGTIHSADEVVAQNNGSQWLFDGNANLNYSGSTGSVTSNTLTSFGSLTLGYRRANPDSCLTSDLSTNWVNIRDFDEYGRVINEQRVFSDNLGRTKQAQQRNLVANRILSQANVYDTYGRLSLTTLPAPISNTDTTCFNYSNYKNFIGNQSTCGGAPCAYGHADFDSLSGSYNSVNNPIQVSINSPLGNYYSNSNNYEAYVAGSGYPYYSKDFNDVVIGGVTRNSGPEDSTRMGKGHETRIITLPVYTEMKHYLTIKNSYYVNAGTNIDGEILKQVSKDQNGIEGITYIDKSGNKIAACLADSNASIQDTIKLQARYSTITLKVPSNVRYTSIAYETTNYFEILNLSTSSTWASTSGNNPYLNLNAGDSIKVSCNKPFTISYNVFTTVSGSDIFSKNKVYSTNYNQINSSTDVHLQKNHSLAINQSIPGCSMSIINLETGASVYSGMVASFTSSGIKPGFYRISFTTQSTNTNSNTNAYLTVTYTARYGNFAYAYFDNAGRLLGQTAPNGVNRASNAKPNYTSAYTYNTLGWSLSYRDTDRGLTYFVYQKDGKLRFSQDSIQRAGNRFSYMNYDNLKRTTETGEYTSGAAFGSPTALYFQDMLNNYNGTSIPSGYTNVFTVLENTDGIDDPRCNTVSKISFDVVSTTPASGYSQRNVNGKVSTSSNNNLTYWYSYDERGRVEWTVEQLAGTTSGTAGGDFSTTAADRVKTMDYVYDFRNNLMRYTFQKSVNSERLDHYYTYDAMQRLYKVQTSLSGGALVEHAQYSYYLHGPLKRKEIGDSLQGLDYVYTVDGKLKGINHPYLDSNDPGSDSYTGVNSRFSKDLFGMMLEYYDNDYVRGTKFQTTSNLTSSGYQQFFNGNIRSWTWNQSACTTTTSLAQYVYKYDNKYQLIEANYGDHSTSTNQFTASSSNKYRVYGITYDVNGNLLTLRRNDDAGTNSSRNYINYVYNTNQNSLQNTQNSVPSDTRTYTYDVLGRMTSYTNTIGDTAKYLTYDYAGRVTAVYKNAAMTHPLATFLYDEKGHRIRKTQYNGASPYNAVTHTYYINDMQGKVLSVYNVTISSSTVVQNEIYIYGDNRIGMVDKYGTAEYHYEIRDHLGNTRVVFKNSGTGTAQVITYSDYYPHGGILPGRQGTIPPVNPRNNCYQGENAERDDETGYINFDLRMYDEDIARWITTDPMHQNWSPYEAMGNNPIGNMDPTGGESGSIMGGPGSGFVEGGPTGGPIGGPRGGDQAAPSRSIPVSGGDRGFSPADASPTWGQYSMTAMGGGEPTSGPTYNDQPMGGTPGAGFGIVSGEHGPNVGNGGMISPPNNFIFGPNGNLIVSYSGSNSSISIFNGTSLNTIPDQDAFIQFIAIVAGESTDNLDEATAIGEVMLNRMAFKKVPLALNFYNSIGGAGQYDAIGEPIYNEIMNESLSDLIDPNNKYASRIQGAIRALSRTTNLSSGAYFWNATSQKYSPTDIGSNWRAYNNNVFDITATIGGTTFFKYNPIKSENPDSYWKTYP